MWWAIATALAAPPAPDDAGLGDDPGREPLVLGGVGERGPEAIVDGIETDDFENVVALAGIDAAGDVAVFCSGSLIQKRWVLTAAHCLSDLGLLTSSGYDLFVLFGGDITGDGYLQAFPWATSEAFPGYNSAAFTDDLGLVQLEGSKLGTRMMVLNDTPPDETWTGEELTFVGYGITGDNLDDSGTKRYTQFPLTGFDDSNLLAGDPALQTNVCNGDSGGATLRTTEAGFELVGINAFVTPGCVGGTTGSTRVDTQLAWILELVPDAFTDPPEPDVDAGGLDLGVDDPTVGLAGLPTPTGGVFAPGCSAAGQSAGFAAAAVAAALLRRRRVGSAGRSPHESTELRA